MSNRNLVCSFSIARDEQPRVLGNTKGKRRWLITLYANNSNVKDPDYPNGIRDRIRTTEKCILPAVLEVATQRINEMMDEADKLWGGYTDAGFQVIKLR